MFFFFSSGYHWPLIINALEKRVPFSLVLLLLALQCMHVRPLRRLGWEANLWGPGPKVQRDGEEAQAAAGRGQAFGQPEQRGPWAFRASRKQPLRPHRSWVEWP